MNAGINNIFLTIDLKNEYTKKLMKKVKDLEEKCRRLVEVGGSSGSGGGGGVDESTVVKKVKSAVNGVAGDVYTNAKGIFNSGESYDGKFVLKQIKNLLKQATKANSK